MEQLLSTISTDRVLDRFGLESRLTNARTLLTTLARPAQTVCLTFKGKPIVGTRSISADFGAKALDAFSEVFTAVAVDSTIDLQSRGRIPEKEKNLLRIVGTVAGSFGFELELPQETTELFTSPEDTIQKIETLLEASAIGSDDDVTDIVSDLSPRTIKLLNKFLGVLVSNESWCGLSYGNKKFYHENLEQVKESAKRLEDDNVHSGSKTLRGIFKGFFPIGRTFEFLPEPEETTPKSVIHGKIDFTIEEPEDLNRHWLDKSVKVTFHSMQIGRGKPRYTLKSLDDLSLQFSE